MAKLKVLLLLIVVLFFAHTICAQLELPASPTESTINFSKYADIEPDLYSGASQVPIPIATISDGPLSMSVSINYHTAGMRTTELASPVGLGWLLNAGGAITREVRGLPDDWADGYLNRGQEVQGIVSQSEKEDIANGDLDGEADLFSYFVNGLSGKFIMDYNGNAHHIPMSNMRIEYSYGNNQQEFLITTTNGTKYYFGGSDYYESIQHSGQNYTTSWFLKKIESFDGHHSIDITYIGHTYKYYSLQHCRALTNEDCEMRIMEIDVDSKVPEQIISGTTQIDFNYSYDRQDMIFSTLPGAARLSSIEIDEGGKEKVFLFTQSYFIDNDPNAITPGIEKVHIANTLTSGEQTIIKKRLKLDQLTIESNSDNSSLPPYEFDYYGKTGDFNGTFFPNYLSKAIDDWGYYNGKTNNNLEDNISPIASNVDRSTSPVTMKYGMLSRVTYPTGGNTHFIYEPNDYWKDDPLNVTSHYSSDIDNDGCPQQISKKEVALKTLNSTITFTTEEYYYGTLYFNFEAICPGEFGTAVVYLRDAQNNNVLTFGGSGTGPYTNSALYVIKNQLNLQANTTYTISVPAGFFQNAFIELYVLINKDGQNEQVGGLRLKQQITDDMHGNDIVNNYSYRDPLLPERSSGKLYKKIDYKLSQKYGADIYTTEYTDMLSGAAGHHIGYEFAQVEYNGNGTIDYRFYCDPTLIDDSVQDSFPIVPEQDRAYLGSPRSVTIRDAQGDTLQFQETVLLEEFFDNDLSPQMIRVSYTVDAQGNPTNTLESNYYFINSGIYVPDLSYSNVEGIGTLTDYEYLFESSSGTLLQPNSIQVYDQNGGNKSQSDIYYTDSYFSFNSFPSDSIQTYLNEYNILQPFLQVNRKFNSLVSRQFTNYGNFYNSSGTRYVYPAQQVADHFSLANPSSFVRDITTFNSYDKGLPVSITPPHSLYDLLYTYNSNSTLQSACRDDGSISLCSSWEYLNNSRLITKAIAVDGTEANYTFDGIHRTLTISDCTGALTAFDYQIDQTIPYIQTTRTFPNDPNNLSQYTQTSSRQYLDGLGNPIQSVGIGQSTDGKDLISALSRDKYGHVVKTYEPIKSTFSDGSYVTPQSSWPFSRTSFEPSPLNRIDTVFSPDWDNKPSRIYLYEVNSLADQVIDPISSITYPAGSLLKRTIIDGNQNRSIHFIDDNNRTILTRRADASESAASFLDSYTIYDKKERPTQVIPPGSVYGDDHLNYYYHYDPIGSVLRKKIPSKAWIDYIYNDRHLLIAQQDSLLKAKNQWYVYNHDDFSREKESGLHLSATAPTGDNPTIHTKFTENIFGTTGTAKAKLIEERTRILNSDDWLRSLSYFDLCGRLAYTRSNNHLNLSVEDSTIVFYDGASNVVRTKHRIVDHTLLPTIIEDYSFLDDDGRTTAQWFSLNGSAQQLSDLRFTDKNELKTKYIGGDSIAHLQKADYNYLHNGLLYQVNEGAPTGTDLYGYQLNYYQSPTITNSSSGSITPRFNGTISSIQWGAINEPLQLNIYKYNYLNRLIETYTNDDLYNTAYGYDKRGNFTSIDRYADIEGTPTQIDDLAPSYMSGNANQMERMNESAMTDKGYKGESTDPYVYDANGNMTHDPQKGITIHYNHLDLPDTITWTDGRQLIFTYAADGSLLQQQTMDSINLKTQDYLGMMEYLDGYPYTVHHAEGRIVNKGLEKYLKYIYLDHQQTESALFAAQQVESIGQIMDSTTLYEASQSIVLRGGFTVDSLAEFTATIVTPPSYTALWMYEYDVRDHLGNLRMTYSALNSSGTIDSKAEILQRIDYYPYGMRRNNYERTTLKNNYQYNGIEHINDFGLDLSMATYRSLDGAMGLWGQVDPMAESFYFLSPYAAMGSNPIMYTDKEGGFIHIVIGGVIGGVGNLLYQGFTGNIGSIGDGFAAFGIGAVAGGVGAATGGASLAAMGTAGSVGAAIGAGAISGAVGGASAGFIQNTGNSLYFQNSNLSDALGSGLQGAAWGALGGAAIGGIAGGIAYKPSSVTGGTNAAAMAGDDVYTVTNAQGVTMEVSPPVPNAVQPTGGLDIAGARATGLYTGPVHNSKSIAPYYPANAGAMGNWTRATLKPGTVINRYGSEYGNYFSPTSTPELMRSLSPANSRALSTYEVIKRLPVESSRVAPAFGKVGTGIQYRTVGNARQLVDLGYLRRVN